MMGGTRFIGLYLARQLVSEGHDVTLFTRGKADVCPQIPDDTPDSYRNFSSCAPSATCTPTTSMCHAPARISPTLWPAHSQLEGCRHVVMCLTH